MDRLTQQMHDELAEIRARNQARIDAGNPSEPRIADLEWRLTSIMIDSGVILAPLVGLAVVALVLYLWLA